MLWIIITLCTMMAVISGQGVVRDCYSTTPSDYDGHQQTTVSGKLCSRWDQINVSAVDFPDSSVYDAANFCRAVTYDSIWCYTSENVELCGIKKCGDDVLAKCGQLSIETHTVLGRNVTFSFTPDTYDPNANLYWQRKSVESSTWSTLKLNYKFTQYQTKESFHLVLTDSVKHDDGQNYRVHYYNKTMYCRMETEKLHLEGNSCGLVQLRSKMAIRNWTVEIDYYPPNIVLANPGNFIRQWRHFYNQKSTQLQLTKGFYEERLERDKYVLTISMFNERMNGGYGVYCGNDLGYTNFLTVEMKEPSVIKFNISGSVLNITEGKQAHVECSAESVPASNISWIEKLRDENVTKKQCYIASHCLLSFDVVVSTRQFICVTQNSKSADRIYLTVNMLKNADKEYYGEKQKINKQAFKVTWIIIGPCLLASIIIAVVLVVVIRKRHQNLREMKESRISYHVLMEMIRNQHIQEYDNQGEENEAVHAREIADELQEHSQPAKKKTREKVDNKYSQVNVEGCYAQPYFADGGDFTYADLDLNRNETSSKDAVKPPTDHAYLNLMKSKDGKGIAHALEKADEVYEYSQVMKKKTRVIEDNTYSQINAEGGFAQQHRTEDEQLIYTDLDFDPNESLAKGDVIKRRDSQAEYADIDYVKTKSQKDVAYTPVEQKEINPDQKSYNCAKRYKDVNEKSSCKIL